MQQLIQWEDAKHSFGIPSIDKQHKKLVELINKTYMLQSGQLEDLNSIMIELFDYIQVHFSYEEELMKRFGFEGYIAHRNEHMEFVGSVMKMFEEYQDNKKTLEAKKVLADRLSNYLGNWLVEHMLTIDRHYVAILKAHGVE